MHTYTAVIERCPDTGFYIGFILGFAGAHSQGETMDELQKNLIEVIEMLLEDGEPALEAEFAAKKPGSGTTFGKTGVWENRGQVNRGQVQLSDPHVVIRSWSAHFCWPDPTSI